MVLTIAVPMIVQNAITNFVSLLDNIMVGQVGTEQMSGVAIANQLIFVFNLCVFGGNGGAGIFTAQFHGKGDPDGIRYTMRFKMILSLLLSTAAITLFTLCDAALIGLFLHDGSASGDLELTLVSGREYLRVMIFGLLPFAIIQTYVGTLREVGETSLPMKAGIAAVLVNLVFNFLLIYPTRTLHILGVSFTMVGAGWGVVGAAAATVLSRFVELAIVIIWSHRHTQRFPFFKKVWRSLRLPGHLVRDIILRGMPLLVNEFIWSFSMTAINQCYSVRGLAVVAAINIASTISNLFNVVYMSLGNAVGIMVGKLLGQGSMDEAVDTDRKLIAFGVGMSMIIGGLLAVTSGLFPLLYNTTDEVRELAGYLIMCSGLLMPMFSFLHCTYFTLRCGGKTVVTFLFDCVFICCVNLPLAYCLAHFTAVDIRVLYLAVQLVDLVKCIIGFVLVKKGIWINNIVGGSKDAAPAQ
ncbi:MAG: MATE family efflux transporter [Oscillospiraceae bacterium]|nr:MATE family efflux transporter [Oscillospiraceae bacterium]